MEGLKSIGRKMVASHAKEIDNRLASDMQKFCARCPNFMINFTTLANPSELKRGEQMNGCMYAMCCSNNVYHAVNGCVFATMQWIDRNRVSDNGDCFIRMDDVPVSMKSQIDSYLKQNQCIIKNSESCTMFVERMISENN